MVKIIKKQPLVTLKNNVPNHWWNSSSIPADDQKSVLNFGEIEFFFLLQEAMGSYNKTKVSPCDPTRFAVFSFLRPEDKLISNGGQDFKQTVSFDYIVHFIG